MQYVAETTDWKLLFDPFKTQLNPDKVIATPVEKNPVPFDNELHEILGQLDTIKSQEVHNALLAGRKVSAGPQWGVHDYKVSSDGTLELLFKPVNYYDNLQDWGLAKNPELKKKVMAVSERKLGNPYALIGRVLAANATVQLLKEGNELSYRSDIEAGKVLPDDVYGPFILTFRDPTQFEYWLTFHNSGGHPKKGDKADSEVVHDWHRVMRMQLVKEFGIDGGSIVDLKLLGLAESRYTSKPDLLYFARVNKTPTQVLMSEGRERDELLGIVPLDSLDHLYELIEKNQRKGEIYHPRDTSVAFRYLIGSLIRKMGLDPNTSNNFCPVGEACLSVVLQKHGYDMNTVYTKKVEAIKL